MSFVDRLDRHLERHPVRHTLVWVAVFAALLVLRVPARFTTPFLFAEEGVLYFQYAWHHTPLDALLHPQLGYYSAWTNLAVTLAAHAVPLERAPLVTTAMGSCVWLLLMVLVHLDCSPFKRPSTKLLAVVLLLLAPAHSGKLHTSFAHFYLCFCTALVLVSDASTRPQRWLQRATLLLAGTSGALSLFLTPLFVHKYLRQGRSREVLVQTGILLACGLLQLGVLVHSSATGADASGERWAGLPLDVFAAAVSLRTWVGWFAGSQAMDAAGRWLFELVNAEPRPAIFWPCVAGLVASTAALGWLIAGPRGLRTRTSRALLAAFALVTLVSLATAVTSQGESKSFLLVKHQRYFVVPNLLLVTAFLLHARGEGAPRWRRAYQLLLAWMLLVGAWSYVWGTSARLKTGPDWHTEVSAWRETPRRPVRIWPQGAQMRLRPALRRKALAGE